MTKQEFYKLCMDMQAILANMFNTLDAWPDDPQFRHIGTGVMVTTNDMPWDEEDQQLLNESHADLARMGVDDTTEFEEHTGPPYNEKPPGGPHVPGEPPPTSNG